MTDSVSHQLSIRRKKKKKNKQQQHLSLWTAAPCTRKTVSILQACQQVLPTFTWENFGFW